MKRIIITALVCVIPLSVEARVSTKPINPAVSTYILLDRTGSMAPIWTEALGSVNAYVADVGKSTIQDQNLQTNVTLAVFDQQNGLRFDVLRHHIKPSEWKDVTSSEASPRGMTPLYDAIGQIVALAEHDAPKRAMIVIMTDGEENSSHEMNQVTAKAALDRARARGWEVVFLGAEFAKFNNAEAVGQSHQNSMAVSKEGLKPTMQRLAKKNRDYGSSAAPAPVTFSAQDRAAAQEEKVKQKK